ncbi:MAG: tetratricopeptide repeat protein [Mariprofundaceae bacterium]|nr:tetratricopeptide repeat protein [Mariprofundaceae bacterium]
MNDASDSTETSGILKKEISGGQLVIAGLLVILALGSALTWEISSSKKSFHDPHAFSLGQSSFEDGRYDDAAHWYQSAAAQGKAEAQYALAMMYIHQQIADGDLQDAKPWLLRAAQQDFAKAQYQLGLLLEKEHKNNTYEHWFDEAAKQGMSQAIIHLITINDARNTPKDSEKALTWLLKAQHQQLKQLLPLETSVLSHIKEQAQHGELQSMYLLANIYRQGTISKKNPKKAYQWMLKAAQHHHIQASESIASMLLKGEGVAKDIKQAFHWYRVTGQAGSSQAKSALGCLMVLGLGTTQDSQQGVEILKSAAQEGNVSATRNLGIIEAEGLNGDINDTAAFQWFKRASDLGDVAASNYLGVMYALGRGVPVDMKQARHYFEKVQNVDSQAQFNLAIMETRGLTDYAHDDKAVYWLQQAESKGNHRASFVLGLFYAKGQGVHQDIPKAIQYYQRAIKHGHIDATYNLAMLEYQGDDGLSLDIDHAIELLTSLAKKGDAQSQNMLAHIESTVNMNFQRAHYWYQQAAQQNYTIAQFNLGNMYRSGRGISQNDKLAVQWYQRAAHQGYAPAQNTLAYMYLHGRGIHKNLKQAKSLLQQASKHLPQAQENLSHISSRSSHFTLLSSMVNQGLRGNLLTTKAIDLSQWFQMKRQPFP